jgi:hypothetical protein
VSGQLHAAAALLPGKESRYPLYRRLGGPQIRYGHGIEEKNPQPPPPTGNRIPIGRAASPEPVAIPTELSRHISILVYNFMLTLVILVMILQNFPMYTNCIINSRF